MQGKIWLGRYEIQRLLGEGGMGKVYLAKQLDLPRQVVVKVMHDHVASDIKFRQRFQRETLLMARFQHPYAVALYDAVLDPPEGPCIVMEHVKGETVDVVIARNNRFSPARAGRLLGQICEVLQLAHSQGIIHRDLKPANLMVTEADTPYEKIKVMDFGLAKLIDPQSLQQMVDSGGEFAIGTPAYMCPEQIRGEDMDQRGDLYSIGVMLYEMLTGKLPFDATSTMDMLLAHATDTPASMNGGSIWIPPAIEKVVSACLAKKPADRPNSARELYQLYDAALQGVGGLEEQPADNNEPVEVIEAPDPIPEDPLSVVHRLQAWMPESIAVYKLRGFIADAGGQVVESVPGCVKVRLGGSNAPNRRGLLGWLGVADTQPLELELRMQHQNGKQQNHLWITVILRPVGRTLAGNWRDRANQVFCDLRGYLIGHTQATTA